ncbi:hypothetical protein PV433_28955 [Paenibacillus sp. GYB004]|uniref:hypothetical protein n=1 Tax=Paenibacillus sp. GYB004 TaxID=2994393 RepID=UPI002F965D83
MVTGPSHPSWSLLQGAALEEELSLSRLLRNTIRLTAERLHPPGGQGHPTIYGNYFAALHTLIKLIECFRKSHWLLCDRLALIAELAEPDMADGDELRANASESIELFRQGMADFVRIVRLYAARAIHEDGNDRSGTAAESATAPLIGALVCLLDMEERKRAELQRYCAREERLKPGLPDELASELSSAAAAIELLLRRHPPWRADCSYRLRQLRLYVMDNGGGEDRPAPPAGSRAKPSIFIPSPKKNRR